MNWKIILGGGIAYFVVTQILSMGFGAFVHTGVLEEAYNQTSSFWRPELNEEPPNIGALMPLWIPLGLFSSLVFAGVFGIVRSAYEGAGAARGLKYGLTLFLVGLTFVGGYYGVFNLPIDIWGWWSVEMLTYFVIGGAIVGVVADKLAPTQAAS